MEGDASRVSIASMSYSEDRSHSSRPPRGRSVSLTLALSIAGCGAASAAPAAPPVPAVSAGAEVASAPPARDPPKSCAEGGVFPVLAEKLSPALPVDYLAIRAYAAKPGLGDPNQWSRVDYSV